MQSTGSITGRRTAAVAAAAVVVVSMLAACGNKNPISTDRVSQVAESDSRDVTAPASGPSAMTPGSLESATVSSLPSATGSVAGSDASPGVDLKSGSALRATSTLALVGRGPAGTHVLNIVAHPDDDLLFLSPDLVSSITSGVQVRTIVLTAGDAGKASGYWLGRRQGLQAAYASMARAANRWTVLPGVQVGIPAASAWQLVGTKVSLVFVDLPDGGPGRGYTSTGHQSLPLLWRDQLGHIDEVGGGGRYTKSGLIQALATAMEVMNADTIRTQDWVGSFGDGDHSDHHAVAYLARAAAAAYGKPHQLVSYRDYATSVLPANVSGSLLTAKRAAFAAYSPWDVDVSTPGGGPQDWNADFVAWMSRQYVQSVITVR